MSHARPEPPLRDSSSSDPRSRGGEFAQLALWMAANLAGMVTAVLLARRFFFESLARRVGRGRTSRRKRPSRRRSLPLLASAIVGCSKEMIESVFGPPRSAAVPDVGVVVNPNFVFWQADVWYYPLPRNGSLAMAINFREDFAATVEFFTAPGL